MLRLPLATLALALLALPAVAQTAPPHAVLPLDKIQNQADLDRTIRALDTQLFDAYNTCDLAGFAALLDPNVEFYHDNGGITLGREALTKSVKDNICNRVTRELLPATFEAHYMKGIGAIEIGSHRFHHPGHDDTEPVGEGRFVHLWVYKDGAWHVTRVYSFDHHSLAKPS